MEDVPSSSSPSTVNPPTEQMDSEETPVDSTEVQDDLMEDEEPAASSSADPSAPTVAQRSSAMEENFVRDLTPEEESDDVSEVEYTVTESESSGWASQLITEEQFAQLRDDPQQLLLFVEQNAEEKWAQQQIDEIDQGRGNVVDWFFSPHY